MILCVERKMFFYMKIQEQLDQWFDAHWEALLKDLEQIVRIPSVARYDDPETPYGPDCKHVLEEMLRLGNSYGFQTKNCENRFGTLTMHGAEPENEIGIWCHLDVVPSGDGWVYTQPFEPVRKGDYLIGRGADDNKGPAVGVMYVLRALQELGIPLRHGIRLFVGTDEEHGMQDVKYFSSHYPSEKLSIIADCGFPVCYGEKGIVTFDLVSRHRMETVTAVHAGIADNIIPPEARMTIGGNELTETGIQGHSAFPTGEKSAIRALLDTAMQCEALSEPDREVLKFFAGIKDDWGESLGIAQQDEISGRTSAVPVGLYLLNDGRLSLRINARTCIACDQEKMQETLRLLAETHGFTMENVHVSPSSYYPRENPVVDAITTACNEVTGLSLEAYVIAGGTYCKYLERAIGCGFGGLPREPTDLFSPGHGGCHQPDEGLYLPNYRKALTVFAMCLIAADRAI